MGVLRKDYKTVILQHPHYEILVAGNSLILLMLFAFVAIGCVGILQKFMLYCSYMFQILPIQSWGKCLKNV